MVSLANLGFAASSSRRFSSTSPWTYCARRILNTLRRDRIRTAREALHGDKSPSRRTPESKKTLGMADGSPLAIKALEAAPSHSGQVFQSLTDRYASAGKRVLNTLAKAKKSDVRGHNHQSFTELDEQNLAPFRELMLFAVLGWDGD